MKRNSPLVAVSLAIGTLVASTAPWAAENGVFRDHTVFGQSVAFDGRAAEFGKSRGIGIAAAFKNADEAGGENDRKLEVVEFDRNKPKKGLIEQIPSPTVATERTSTLSSEDIQPMLGNISVRGALRELYEKMVGSPYNDKEIPEWSKQVAENQTDYERLIKLIFEDFRDGGPVIFLGEGDEKITTDHSGYSLLSFEELASWKRGEEFSLSSSPNYGTILVRHKTNRAYKLNFRGLAADEAFFECPGSGGATTDILRCLSRKYQILFKDYNFIYNELYLRSSVVQRKELQSFEISQIGMEHIFFRIFHAYDCKCSLSGIYASSERNKIISRKIAVLENFISFAGSD